MNRKFVQESIKILLDTEWDELTPEQINNGNCEKFAKDIVDFIGKGEVFWLDNPAGVNVEHAIYRLDGYYYDAENPEGVSDPENLIMVKEIKFNR